jgi:hypothetical protein
MPASGTDSGTAMPLSHQPSVQSLAAVAAAAPCAGRDAVDADEDRPSLRGCASCTLTYPHFLADFLIFCKALTLT